MSNSIKPVVGNAPLTQSSLLSGQKHTGRDLSEGVAQTFPLISLRGGKWRYRWQGEENVINDPRTGFASPILEVVIVDASKTLTKMFYKDAYAEGQRKRPDCWSSDGKVPDATVQEPVSEVCLTCPKNAFGSQITPSGKPAKACQDRRRIVIVPSSDIMNEEKGGPILLSIPPGSLKNSQAYGDFLDENELAYYGCVTQLSFDQKVSHPKIEFNYVRALDDDDVRSVLGLRGSESVKRILNAQFNPDSQENQVDNEPQEDATEQQQEAAPAPAKKTTPGPAPITPKSNGPAATTQAAKSGITDAVKKPATPPPSTRQVQTPGARPVKPATPTPPPAQRTPAQQAAAQATLEQQAEAEERAMSPVDDAFAKLMSME